MEHPNRPREACVHLAGNYYPQVVVDKFSWGEAAAISAYMPWKEFADSLVASELDPENMDPRSIVALAWVAVHRVQKQLTIEEMEELPIESGFEFLAALEDEEADGNPPAPEDEGSATPSASSSGSSGLPGSNGASSTLETSVPTGGPGLS